jgi:hypothetical protein
MLLPMLVASFAAMLVPTLLRNAPLYESLREHILRGERFGVSKIEGVSSARLTPERHPGTALCRASRLAISMRALSGRNLRRANVD